MGNAGIATARSVTEFCKGDVAEKSLLVLCGKGNNGGDDAAAARLLAITGAHVDVVLIGKIDDTKGDARENFNRLRAWKDEQAVHEGKATAVAESGVINLFECESEKGWEQLLASVLSVPHDVTIDALFGTGLTRPLEGIHREVVRYVNRLREMRDVPPHRFAAIVSIDIPSGLNADCEDQIGEAVSADATVTMTAPKRANVLPPASDYHGKLIVADIGSPPELIAESQAQLFLTESDDARRWLFQTRYTPGSHKKRHGHLLIV